MKRSNACGALPKCRHIWIALLVFCQLSPFRFAVAQQQSPSGAVETFDSAFDVGVMMRPRAGLFGITELMMAALEADIPRAEALIRAGADINETDDSQSTALMWAVHSGDVETVEYFIANGADVGAIANGGATALINAMSTKHQEIAVVLIESGADPNGRGNRSRNFLESAAESGMIDVVAALLANGADLTTHGSSALRLAVTRGQQGTAALLLDAGVDVNATTAASERSLLSVASMSGNVGLVRLLISKGARIEPPTANSSPLSSAIARGHSEVVEFLIGEGAVPTAKHILAAAQNGDAGIAVALIRRVDLNALEQSDIENLVAAADDLANETFTELLLASGSAQAVKDEAARLVESTKSAAASQNARLLFTQQRDDQCLVGVWDTRTRDIEQLANVATCSGDVFMSGDSRTVFVVDGNAIRLVSIDKSVQARTVQLPGMDYRDWLEQMTLRPDKNPDYLPSSATMTPIGLGNFDDGAIGLLVRLWMPADDEFHYVLRYEDGTWSIIEERWCGRWGCDEPIRALEFRSTNIWSWPESRMIWHPYISLNPYFSSQSTDTQNENYQATQYEREFEIDGRTSVLTAFTSPSEHSDTTHTFNVELTVPDGSTHRLSENQCLTSIVGRFILVREFFGGRFELTDLGTGRTAIEDISAAMWLD